MKNAIFLVLISSLFIACSATYTQESLSSDFAIGDFKNTMQTAKQSDSLSDIFDDKDLRSLINMALSQNSDIFIYETRIKTAQSQVNLVLSKQIPDISASASYSFNGDSTINTSLMASWELDIFGKYANLKNAKLEQLNIAKSNLKYFQISLVSDIALAYFNLKYLYNNIILSKERIKNYKELLVIMDTSYKNGFVSFSDFLEKKMDLQSEEQNLNTLLNDYEAKKNEIRVLINNRNYHFIEEMPTEIYSFYESDFELPSFSLNLESPADIILNRPDISAQIASLNAAVHNLNAAKAELYPTINISGSLGKAFLQPADFIYSILASIAMPLFSRFELYENVKISDYTRIEAYYTLQKGVNTAFSEIENAIYALEANKSTLKTSIEMLRQNKEVLDLLAQSFSLGLIDRAEYLSAINNHLAMMKSNNTSFFNATSAIIYLYRAVGGNENDIKIDSANEVESTSNKDTINE